MKHTVEKNNWRKRLKIYSYLQKYDQGKNTEKKELDEKKQSEE